MGPSRTYLRGTTTGGKQDIVDKYNLLIDSPPISSLLVAVSKLKVGTSPPIRLDGPMSADSTTFFMAQTTGVQLWKTDTCYVAAGLRNDVAPFARAL
jgi:hypothetical protein